MGDVDNYLTGFADDSRLAKCASAVIRRLIARGRFESFARYGGVSRSGRQPAEPPIAPNAAVERNSTEWPSDDIAFLSGILHSAFCLKTEFEFYSHTGLSIATKLELIGSDYSGFSRSRLIISCDSRRVWFRADQIGPDFCLQALGSHRFTLGREFIANTDLLCATALDIFLTVVGNGNAEDTFPYLNFSIDGTWSTSATFIHHAAPEGFGGDFIRDFVLQRCQVDIGKMLPDVSAATDHIRRAKKAQPNAEQQELFPMVELDARKLDEIAAYSPEEWQTRLQIVPMEFDNVCLIEHDQGGVTLAVPLYDTLANVYRSLAGIAHIADSAYPFRAWNDD